MEPGNKPVPDGSCAFYLERKRRYCRFQPHVGQKYCAEHAGLLGVYHSSGINAGSCDESDTGNNKVTFSEIPLGELQAFIDKINQLYDKYVKDLDQEILTHHCLNEELKNETYGIQAIRHRKQQASLIGHLEKMGLLNSGNCYVEMGAGKGGLSHWIQKALDGVDDVSFVLIDRSSVRYKFDNLHKWEENGPKFERLRIDIENLNLAKVESISKGDKPVVAVGKHLCGCATAKKNKEDERLRIKLGGLTVALCCHHRCNWKSYVGKNFFNECGLTASDFHLMCKLSGWGTDNWKGWKSLSEMEAELCDNSKTCNTYPSSSDNSLNITNYNKDQMGSEEPTNSSKRNRESCNIQSDLSNQNYDTGHLSNMTQEFKVRQQPSHQDEESKHSKGKGDISEKTCNKADENLSNTSLKTDNDETLDEHSTTVSWKRSDLKLSDEERATIGWKCKRLIDIGRVFYLKDKGLHSELKIYIDYKLTPENVAIFVLPS
ncbi:hypothetical protein KUTeg_005827 [Tegillarca granosa]|uniref:tRNA:m(4)X modification enzyme TRM13 n=1 Tax=Tegillarca granosa TaxID=220873 RepID=A0ABQ9FLN2_TEGGR|nr:hypothetical protein KUTeg_005827 [Tegillarca granosa]